MMIKNNQEFLLEIKNEREWDLLSKKPTDIIIFSDTQLIKVVYIIKSKLLIFLNTKKFTNHLDWIEKYDKKVSLEYFNSINYHESPERQFILGTLTKINSMNIYTFELCPEDNLVPKSLLELMKLIISKIYFKETFYFRTNSIQSEINSKILLDEKMKVISTNFLYKQLDFISYFSASSVGYFKILKKVDPDYEMKLKNITENDIVLMDHIPNYLPLSAGIITSKFQSPLSHIVLLSSNRKIPNAFIRNIFDTLTIKEHDFVKFETKDTNFTLIKTPKIKLKKIIYPKIDIPEPDFESTKQLLKLSDCNIENCGIKASNLVEFNDMKFSKNVKIYDEGMVIPFSEFHRHLQPLLDSNFKLEEIQEQIDSIKINQKLLKKIKKYMKKEQYIFRSSSNAEDLPNFNGAGLYQSIKVTNPSDIQFTIKSIWKSIYSPHAIGERNKFKIDHSKVGMAILIQPYISNIKFSGVALTKSHRYEDFDPVMINIQPTSGYVTDSSGGFPEQVILFHNFGAIVQEIISKSDLSNDPLMSITEGEMLYKNFIKIDRSEISESWKEEGSNCVNIEFIMKNSTLYILQIRPHFLG
eukprot:gene3772-6660_t